MKTPPKTSVSPWCIPPTKLCKMSRLTADLETWLGLLWAFADCWGMLTEILYGLQERRVLTLIYWWSAVVADLLFRNRPYRCCQQHQFFKYKAISLSQWHYLSKLNGGQEKDTWWTIAKIIIQWWGARRHPGHKSWVHGHIGPVNARLQFQVLKCWCQRLASYQWASGARSAETIHWMHSWTHSSTLNIVRIPLHSVYHESCYSPQTKNHQTSLNGMAMRGWIDSTCLNAGMLSWQERDNCAWYHSIVYLYSRSN